MVAAWEQLVASGYAAFTFDAIAERAGTSKPVLYRRWPNREALVVAAVQHFMSLEPQPIPDTGTLRGDVIEMLTRANETRSAMAAVISVQLGAFYQETGTTPADFRGQILADRVSGMETVMQRAVERGEVTTAHLTPRIVALPF
ncbi:MAG: TetR family transcriptional regulator, partial [Frondihabitans sp.]|nr:TetR family transcriptional regulator [Frondihabitans sp.]